MRHRLDAVPQATDRGRQGIFSRTGWVVRHGQTDVIGVKRQEALHVQTVRDPKEFEYPAIVARAIRLVPEGDCLPTPLFDRPSHSSQGGSDGAKISTLHWRKMPGLGIAARCQTLF